ncbi:MAG: hypothetical protein IPL73_06470 [Candidatus Obscuribacter sp.]|nr:hypothetical protein [Candidatus Obscuribacter sp.]
MFEKVVVTVIAIIFGVTANHFVFSGLARLSVNATYFGITICIVGGGLAMGLLDIARVNDTKRQGLYCLIMVANAASMLCAIWRLATMA